MAALDPCPPDNLNDVVVIGIDKDKYSQYAVKWAVNNLATKEHLPVFLVHVRTQSLHDNPASDARTGRAPTEQEMHQLFLPYRGFCARKGIDAKEVVLHDIEVSSALVEYITTNLITNVVVGASNRNALTRKFKAPDVPTAIGKSTPEYCALYVVGKGKAQCLRSATTKPRASTSSSTTTASSMGDPSPHRTASTRKSTPRLTTSLTMLQQFLHYSPSSQEPTSTSTSISWVSTSDKSVDHTSEGGDALRKFTKSPELKRITQDTSQDSNSFSMTSSSSNSQSFKTSRSSSSCSTTHTEDIEAEMQRLRLNLHQNMEALRNFHDEANSTQQVEKKLEEKQKASMGVTRLLEKQTSNIIQYKKYSLEEIERATDYFSTSLKVGEGGYGPVYRATLDNTEVAIKVLRPDVSQGLKQFKQEIDILSRLKHPNLVLLLGACPEYGCLVYEYLDYGSLEDRLFLKDNTPPIPCKIRFQIAAKVANALYSLHTTKPVPLVHRDLKPANILLDHNFVPKICDVGIARMVPPSAAESMTSNCHMTAAAGTFFYIDPEYQQTGMLSVKSDVYSFGVILLQLITGRTPMGLSFAVENAIEEGNLAEVLDPSVEDWPLDDTLTFARMALKCCELRKRDRPSLGLEILPELTRLSSYDMG